MNGVKHLIQCHCMLPQYKNLPDPVFHKFVVFSIVGDDDEFIPKFSQCNNCGVIHKVVDACKSEIVRGSDESSAILTIDDIKMSLTKDIASILDVHKCDLATFEMTKFLYENSIWDYPIVISKETVDDVVQLKILTLLDEQRLKIESKLREDTISGS